MAEEYNPEIVSVIDETGEEHIFEELDRIETDDARYVALLPVYDDAEDILDDDGEIPFHVGEFGKIVIADIFCKLLLSILCKNR